MNEGKWQEAAQTWEAVATATPTADAWNETAYAWLQAGAAEKAVAAGKKALELKPDHPYALYNTGMAQLKLGDWCSATASLAESAHRQPDRWEPALALAEALARGGNGPESAEPLRKAVQLGAPSTEIAPVERLVNQLAAPPTIGELTKNGKMVGQVEEVSFYNWSNPGRLCKSAPQLAYWVVVGDQVHPLPREVLAADAVRLLTALPEGDKVYLLRGEESYVYVAAAKAYYVVRIRAGAPELIRFVWPEAKFPEALKKQWALYSSQYPTLRSTTELATQHRHPASGKSTILLTWQIDWAKGVGTLAGLQEDNRDPNK